LNIATMGAEATDVRSVKQDLDYKFVKASEAYARAWREAYMPGSISKVTGGMDDVEGRTDEKYIEQLQAGTKYKLVGKEGKTEEVTSVKKGKYPSGLSRKQFKEYQKQLGEEPKKKGLTGFDYWQYWAEDHFPNLVNPGYEVDREKTESVVVRNKSPENINDFREIWKTKTKGTEYENWSLEKIDEAYYDLLNATIPKSQQLSEDGTVKDPLEDFVPLGANMFAETFSENKNLGLLDILGLTYAPTSEEERNAEILVNNTVIRNDYEAYKYSHPGVSFEDWKQIKIQDIKNSQKSETVLETKNVPSGNRMIQTMLKNKSLGGLTNLDLSIEKYTKSQMEEMGTTAGEVIKSISAIGEIKSISAPMRIREAGDYTKIGGYQFNVTDEDGNIYRIQTQPLDFDEASVIAPIQNMYRDWNNMSVVQSPSAVGEDAVITSNQITIGSKTQSGWIGTDGALLEDINNLIEAGIVKEEDISRGVTLEVSYAPFNTYGKGGDFQNRGIKKYHKVTEDGRRTPLFDPRYYDQTLMNENYKRQQIEKGNLKEEDFLTEEGLGIVRSLMMNRSDFANFIRQRSNIDYLREQRVSAPKFRSSINPGQ